MGEKYNSIADVLDSIVDDEEYTTSLRREIKGKNIAKQLAAMRAASGLSQKDLADAIGCSQSKVSKIEHSRDVDISLKEICDYTRVLETGMTINVGEQHSSATDLVKFHAFGVRDHLMRLTELAGNDPKIKQGVADFYVEAMSNIFGMIIEGVLKLESDPNRLAELFHLSGPSDSVKVFVTGDTADCSSELQTS